MTHEEQLQQAFAELSRKYVQVCAQLKAVESTVEVERQYRAMDVNQLTGMVKALQKKIDDCKCKDHKK